MSSVPALPRNLRLLLPLLVALLGITAAVLSFVPVPGTALASHTQQAGLADRRLLLGDSKKVRSTLRILRRLGVDRVRIAVIWDTLAPGANSRRKPAGFAASDPAAYPASDWLPYDRLVRESARYGLRLNFDVDGGAPLWAVRPTPSASMAHVWYPSARAFQAFVRAVGTRYSGRYTPPGSATPLPRVSSWSLWNEPNVGSSSLSPQTVGGVEVAPRLYRALADAGFSALRRTGHTPRSDTILLGETASTGHLHPGAALGMQPLRFLRALYCVGTHYRPLRGQAARRRGCPSDVAASRVFRADNPVLFNASGWSHHPYNLTMAPDVPAPAVEKDWVTLADLPKLERALDLVHAVYGSTRRWPIYLTEYGVETNPPRADFPTTPAVQAAYLNQAEYLTWRDPRVQLLTQFLLQDSPPAGRSRISAFASGLIFLDGVKKPAFAAYRLPLWMPKLRAKGREPLEVWGCVRPAKRYPRTKVEPVAIQLDGRTVAKVIINNPEGYFDVRVPFAHGGVVRLLWRYPGGRTVYSREVRITTTGGGSNVALIAIVAVIVAGVLALGAFALRRRAFSRL